MADNKLSKNGGLDINGQVNATNESWDQIKKVDWEEKTADLSTGIRMYYQVMGPESGRPILLIHGGGDCRVAWSNVAPILAKRGFRLYIPELRGHGKTDKPLDPKGYYVMEDYAADIAALIDSLGLEKVDLAGHSCGSLTSQLVAAAHPDRIRSITLIASGTTVEAFESFNVSEDDVFDEAFFRDWASCTIDDTDFRTATFEYVKQLPMPAWRQIINGIKYFNSREKLKDIICPVQIIWGTEDAVFNAGEQELLQKGLVNTTVKFIKMEGCSHSPHWDSWENVELVAKYIGDFVADH